MFAMTSWDLAVSPHTTMTQEVVARCAKLATTDSVG
jgi:hypothetical protein